MSQNGYTSHSQERVESFRLEAVIDSLQAALIEWPKNGNSYFFPIDKIRELENETLVDNVVREMFPGIDVKTHAKYVDSIRYGATKILAILLYSSSGTHRQAIGTLIDEGISDRDLPFARVYTDDMNGTHANPQNLANRRYTLGKGDHDSCELGNHNACGIMTFAKWPRMEIQNFCRDQWTTMSPVFERGLDMIYHYDIPDTVVLPFIDDQETDKEAIKQGGYSEVWSTRIHPAHQTILRSADPLGPVIAVKRLFSRVRRDFDKERHMLSSLTLKGHLHLVKLLTTYTYKGRFHFLCPFAKANLLDYWKSKSSLRNEATYLWTLKQIAGLASALNVIHNFRPSYPLGSDYADPIISGNRPSLDIPLNVDPAEELFGRHGDLKPENILWFNDLESFDDAGILQIADLGLGRFHRLESRSKQDPRTITGSPTYIPPELPLQKYVSRAYDIWSLGCIFLEFVTWLVEGPVGLDNFGQARLAPAHDGVYDDTFYILVNSNSDRKFGEVRKAVTNWMERLRRGHSDSEMVVQLLDVVRTRMLRVNSEDRIKAEELDLLLKSMLQKGETDPVYLLGDQYCS